MDLVINRAADELTIDLSNGADDFSSSTGEESTMEESSLLPLADVDDTITFDSIANPVEASMVEPTSVQAADVNVDVGSQVGGDDEIVKVSNNEEATTYKGMLKMDKGRIKKKKKNGKKNLNRPRTWVNGKISSRQTPTRWPRQLPHQSQQPSMSVPLHPGFIPQEASIPGFFNGVWTYGMSAQHLNGFSAHNSTWLQQNHQQQLQQLPFPNGFPKQPFVPWSGFVGQTNFNQLPFVDGFQPRPPINFGQLGYVYATVSYAANFN